MSGLAHRGNKGGRDGPKIVQIEDIPREVTDTSSILRKCPKKTLLIAPHKQEKGDSCVAASLKVALSRFDINFTEEELRVACGYRQNDGGISLFDLRRGAQSLGLNVEDYFRRSADFIIEKVSEGKPVIVSYEYPISKLIAWLPFLPKSFHSSVVYGYDGDILLLFNVYKGKTERWTKTEFEKVWIGDITAISPSASQTGLPALRAG
jgi:ABC-type bacteriocin/lantibiotic exporter with double-glycine peptidase domain